MHVPDHVFSPEMAIVAGSVSVAAVSYAATTGRRAWTGPDVALMAAVSALIFGAQMVNYAVLPGTSGHLIGAALSVALVGPRMALLVMATVLAVQAMIFGDGGVTALGINVLLMGVIPVLATVLVQRGVRVASGRPMPRLATMLAALVSVPVAALAFVSLYAIGGVGQTSIGALAAAMGGVHVLIGTGEAVISLGVVSFVLAVAPELAAAAPRTARRASVSRAVVALAGVTVVCATLLSVIAAVTPDGLESVILSYQLPVGAPVLTGAPLLSAYGEFSGVPISVVGLTGVAITAAVAALAGIPLTRAARPGAV